MADDNIIELFPEIETSEKLATLLSLYEKLKAGKFAFVPNEIGVRRVADARKTLRRVLFASPGFKMSSIDEWIEHPLPYLYMDVVADEFDIRDTKAFAEAIASAKKISITNDRIDGKPTITLCFDDVVITK